MDSTSKFIPPYKQNARLKSSDLDDLIELSLHTRDEQWFHDLVQKKKTLEHLEKDASHELGFNEIH